MQSSRTPIKELRKKALKHYEEASNSISHHSSFVVSCIKECTYPDWCGGYITGKHRFDKDGFCVICGVKKLNYKEEQDKADVQLTKDTLEGLNLI
jgi:hypothetical protein